MGFRASGFRVQGFRALGLRVPKRVPTNQGIYTGSLKV